MLISIARSTKLQKASPFAAFTLLSAFACSADLASMPPGTEGDSGSLPPDDSGFGGKGDDAGAGGTSSDSSVASANASSTGSGGSTAAPCDALPLCDDFEDSDVGGSLNPALWSIMHPNCSGSGTVTVDDTQSHSGSQSVKVTGTNGYCNHVFFGHTAALEAITGTLYGRFYVRFDAALYQGHITFMALRDEADGGKDLRMGGQNQVLMWNRESDDATLPSMSPEGTAMSVAPEVGAWLCVEFTISAGGITTTVDGAPVEGLVLDSNPTQHVDAQWSTGIDPSLADFKLGWESYSGGPMDLWFDDVALSDSPIGCL